MSRDGAGPIDLSCGLALSGTVWVGGPARPAPDWVVLIDPDGRVAQVGPSGRVALPDGVRRAGGPGHWVGPGIVDAHVHLSFGEPEDALRHGVVGLRDLGAPPDRARGWRGVHAGSPLVAVAGPLLTAPGGYPSTSWGRAGFTRGVVSPADARAAVRELVGTVDVVKLALEPAGGPVPSAADCRAVVEAAHDAALRVTAHALTAGMVSRALDAGVDELCHTPTEPLDAALLDRIAASGVVVVSTLQTFCAGGDARGALGNAAALVSAGVPLVYGTDLGNAGTRPGVDPVELDRLAAAGLGPLGALRAATEGSAELCNLGVGRISESEPAALVLLPADPVADATAWRDPELVVVGGAATRLRRAPGRSAPA